MNTSPARWEPDRDPIHRFLFTLDFVAAMVACHRWRPLDPSPAPPRDGPCPPPDRKRPV